MAGRRLVGIVSPEGKIVRTSEAQARAMRDQFMSSQASAAIQVAKADAESNPAISRAMRVLMDLNPSAAQEKFTRPAQEKMGEDFHEWAKAKD